VSLLVALTALGAVRAPAQTAEAEQTVRAVIDPTAYRLDLKAIPELEQGKIAMAEGTAGPGGVRFVAENLSILQPVVVTVLAKDPDDDVRVSLSKYRYDESDRSGTTKGEGMYTTRLRTQGDLKVVVSSPDPKPFQLVVWAGDEVAREMPPVIVSDPDAVSGSGGWGLGGSVVMWVIAGALLAIVGLLAVIVLRGRAA